MYIPRYVHRYVGTYIENKFEKIAIIHMHLHMCTLQICFFLIID
jgi:hypothetical protein